MLLVGLLKVEAAVEALAMLKLSKNLNLLKCHRPEVHLTKGVARTEYVMPPTLL
jgi:hypothetical protein